jgi:hypothetical protein
MLGIADGPTVRGVSIDELVKACVHRRYMVPPLQRPPVWGLRDQQRLLASVLAARPIGSMLVVGRILDQHDGEPAVAVGDRIGLDGVRVTARAQAQEDGDVLEGDQSQEPEAFILDGQQRLFALMSGFLSPRKGPRSVALDGTPIWCLDLKRVVETLSAMPVEYRDMYTAVDTAIRRIHRWRQVDPQTLGQVWKIFARAAQSGAERRRFHVPLGMLLSVDSSRRSKAEPILSAFERWYPETSMAHSDPGLASRIAGLLRRVRDYRVPIVRIEECTDVEAASIFEQNNTRGWDLETNDVACANIFVRDPGARRVLRAIEAEAAGALQGIESRHVLEASIHAGVPIGSSLQQLDRRAILAVSRDEDGVRGVAAGAKAVLAALPIAAELLESCGVVDFKSCPVPAVSVALLAAIARHPDKDEVARVGTCRLAICRWWWSRTLLAADRARGRFSVNQLLADWEPLPQDTMPTWDTSPWTLEAFDIDPRKVHSGSKAKALNALLRTLQLKDFLSFRTGSVLQQDLDLHHIFPRAWLTRQGRLKEGHCFANLTLISRETNRVDIRDKSPSEYVAQLSGRLGVTDGRAQLARVLAQHGIDMDLLEQERLDDFLAHRSEWFGERLRHLDRSLALDQLGAGHAGG